jgi:hypothetical protein
VLNTVDKKQRKEYEENMALQDDATEEDEDRIQQEMNLAERKNYPSDSVPQDFFQFKLQRMNPNASTDFRGSIDKDWTLANLSGKKPELQELNFKLGTHTLLKNVFTVEQNVPLTDSDGNALMDSKGRQVFMKGKVFDDTFQPVLEYVLGDIKSLLVGSRALGADREAVLLEQQGFKKVVEKRKEQQNKVFGMGGAQ